MTTARTTSRALAVVVLLVVAESACTPPQPPAPDVPVQPSTPAAAIPVDCEGSVRTGPLPEWARAGFTGDGSSFRHVEGLSGEAVGVLFGYPLTSPPRPDRANKILWVAHDRAGGRLVIDARLDGTGPVVTREVGFGGGQSIVDLPAPGCWRLTLRWGDHVTDSVDVPYVRRR